MNKILVTVATGTTGAYVIRHLLRRKVGHINAKVHNLDERSKQLKRAGVEDILGHFLVVKGLEHALMGMDSTYFLLSISRCSAKGYRLFYNGSKTNGGILCGKYDADAST